MKKKTSLKKILSSFNFLLSFGFIVAISFITIGFAAYDELIPINGDILVKKFGIMEITNITLVDSSNVSSSAAPSFEKDKANFEIVFSGSGEKNAVYQVEVTNNSSSDYIYSGINYDTSVTGSTKRAFGTLTATESGINNGDILRPGEVKLLTVTFSLDVTDETASYTVSSNAGVGGTNDSLGRLAASLNSHTANLKSPNTTATFTIDVINTYTIMKEFSIYSSNANFEIVDGNGVKIDSLEINANARDTFTFYLKPKTGAVFLNDTATTSVMLSSNNTNTINVGLITCTVDLFVMPDVDAPTVGAATINITDTVGTFTANWNRIDEGGSNITNYTILLYKSDNTLVSTTNTNSDVTSKSFENISAGSYYIIVYGVDAAGNSGEEAVSSATTSNGEATKSSTTDLKWVFNIDGTSNVSNISFNGNSTANLHTSYSATLTANNNYSLPNSITITMGGRTLTSGTDYTYTRNSGSIVINSITGDVVITASGSYNACLVKGTKILLANGKYKNIENIDYTDLLKVFNYETGSYTYEYPIWIEKEHQKSFYQLTTFSDGTTLKTVGFHGVFSADLNRFVSVDNPSEFKVGTNIYKYVNNKLVKVKVVSIKEMDETVSYYHVVSTRYYNIIANDFLTTDGTVILSNLYGFNKDLTWTSKRTLNNLYSYDEFKGYVPYNVFVGMRMEEAKELVQYGLDKETFINYLLYNQLNDQLYLKNNNWMVTTSDDNVNELNKKNYLLKEGSKYTLKQPKNKVNFVGWLDTSSNKMYKPGETITVYTGVHFIATYK